MAGKTVITITHRLASVQDSDIIYVIDNGQVQGKGKHKQLLETSQLFRYEMKGI